ncbi:ABC transporter permease [bacterium]|nr:ABC transporter permease [bacterium]
MKNQLPGTLAVQVPVASHRRVLPVIPIIFFLPIALSIFQVFDSHLLKIGMAVTLCSIVFAVMITHSVLNKRYKLVLGLLLIIPIYFSISVASSDFSYFSIRTMITSFPKSLSPGGDFFMGTDYEGRDILATIIIGGMNAYLVATIATIIALLLGIPIGLALAGKGKLVGNVASVITQFFEIVPQLFFVLIVLGVFNFWAAHSAATRLVAIYAVPMAGLAIGLSSLPSVARIIENRVLQLSSRRFVTALRSSNVNSAKILFYNILWKNCLTELIVQATFLFGATILVESALGYAFEIGFGELGTGGYLSWGKILAEARRSILFIENLWIVAFPILVTIMSILGVNLIGDTLVNILSNDR